MWITGAFPKKAENHAQAVSFGFLAYNTLHPAPPSPNGETTGRRRQLWLRDWRITRVGLPKRVGPLHLAGMLEEREPQLGAAWRELAARRERELTQLEADGRGIRGVIGHLRCWRQRDRMRELGAATGVKRTLLRRWKAELEARQLGEQLQLGRPHVREVRGIEKGGIER